MTGEPFNLGVPGSIINAPGNPNTPNLVGNYRVTKGVGTSTTWFDPSVFAQPAANTFGNLGRPCHGANHICVYPRSFAAGEAATTRTPTARPPSCARSES